MSDPHETARRQRRIGATILGTVLIWGLVQFLAARFGWPLRVVGLIDLFALAILGWALWQSVALWRTRKEGQ